MVPVQVTIAAVCVALGRRRPSPRSREQQPKPHADMSFAICSIRVTMAEPMGVAYFIVITIVHLLTIMQRCEHDVSTGRVPVYVPVLRLSRELQQYPLPAMRGVDVLVLFAAVLARQVTRTSSTTFLTMTVFATPDCSGPSYGALPVPSDGSCLFTSGIGSFSRGQCSSTTSGAEWIVTLFGKPGCLGQPNVALSGTGNSVCVSMYVTAATMI